MRAVGRDRATQLLGGLLTPFPPVRAALGGLRRLPRAGGLGFVRTLLTPADELATQRFGGTGLQSLLAGNAGHADIPLDAPGSGLMGLLMSMLGQTVGFPVPRGGAGELTQALARRFRSQRRRGPLRRGGDAAWPCATAACGRVRTARRARTTRAP